MLNKIVTNLMTTLLFLKTTTDIWYLLSYFFLLLLNAKPVRIFRSPDVCSFDIRPFSKTSSVGNSKMFGYAKRTESMIIVFKSQMWTENRMGIENSATKHHKLCCTDSAGVGISLTQWKICVSVQKGLHTLSVVVSFHVEVLLFTYVYCDRWCNGFSVLFFTGVLHVMLCQWFDWKAALY